MIGKKTYLKEKSIINQLASGLCEAKLTNKIQELYSGDVILVYITIFVRKLIICSWVTE